MHWHGTALQSSGLQPVASSEACRHGPYIPATSKTRCSRSPCNARRASCMRARMLWGRTPRPVYGWQAYHLYCSAHRDWQGGVAAVRAEGGGHGLPEGPTHVTAQAPCQHASAHACERACMHGTVPKCTRSSGHQRPPHHTYACMQCAAAGVQCRPHRYTSAGRRRVVA